MEGHLEERSFLVKIWLGELLWFLDYEVASSRYCVCLDGVISFRIHLVVQIVCSIVLSVVEHYVFARQNSSMMTISTLCTSTSYISSEIQIYAQGL